MFYFTCDRSFSLISVVWPANCSRLLVCWQFLQHISELHAQQQQREEYDADLQLQRPRTTTILRIWVISWSRDKHLSATSASSTLSVDSSLSVLSAGAQYLQYYYFISLSSSLQSGLNNQRLYWPWKVLKLKCWFPGPESPGKDIGPGKPWESAGILK